MSDIELFLDSRDRFFKRTLLSSGIGVLVAAASRLPTWEVAAPVDWLIGTVNVGFAPIFGPIVIFGCYCFTMLALDEMLTIQRDLSHRDNLSSIERAVVEHTGIETPRGASGRQRVVSYAMRFWVFLVPLIAYTILLVTYLDFVRPEKDHAETPMFKTHHERLADILLGTGGWGSFKPLTPSIADNLAKRADAAEKPEEKERIRRVAAFMPYIHAPLQTWAYLLGLVSMIYMAAGDLPSRLWKDAININSKRRAKEKPPSEPAEA